MKKVLGIALTFGVIALTTSCYTDPDPGTGIVIVKDANDFRVPVATVTLSQPGQTGNGIILVTGYTDVNGEFAYEHAPALEVILNIGVEKDNMTGQGVIRIKPGETIEEEVVLY